MSPNIDLLTEAPGWENLAWLDETTERAVAAALAGSGVKTLPEAEISILLCDDARIRELNAQWRNIDKPTNVLSFPAADPKGLAKAPLLGDIAVAYETVEREASTEAKPFQDHYTHLVVHGVLHLLGFDHEDDEEAETMENLERQVLAGLGIADPYGGPAREPDEP